MASYDGWTIANEPGNWQNGPWGLAPATGSLPGQNPVSGFVGTGLVNGFNDGDWPVGTLESPTFTISDDYINFLIGGGRHPHSSDLSWPMNRPRAQPSSTSNCPTGRLSPTPDGTSRATSRQSPGAIPQPLVVTTTSARNA